MSSKVFFLFALTLSIIGAASADIFGDLLGWDIVGALTGDVQEKSPAGQREDEDGTSKCECEGRSCNCCVDFNLTSIVDLGGPGCVKMRYISQNEGVSLNVSYGDNLLHSRIVKQKDKKGSCIDLLSKFAQICARFRDLKATDDGLEGCLHFEPHVLGEITSKYHVGCFKMGPEGMVQDEVAAEPQEEQEDDKKPANSEEEGDEDDDDGSSILDVVNHSAEKGISFLSDLLGFGVPAKKNKTTTEKPAEEESTETDEESEDSQENGRKLKSHRTRLGRVHFSNNVV